MTRTKLDNNQSGLASILVTMIMMIVITLIVLGFVQVSNREQSTSLDNQLSTQALYAAESGVDDAIRAIQSGVTTKTTCAPDAGNTYLSSDNVGQASYTCLLINPAPGQLQFSSISPSQSMVVPIQLIGSNTSPTITVTWANSGTTPNFSSGSCSGFGATGTTFPSSEPASCPASVVQLDLVEGPQNAIYTTVADMTANTLSDFLVPSDLAGSMSYSTPITSSSNGQTIQGNCSGAWCTATITGLNATMTGGYQYYLRILPLYSSTAVHLTVSSPDAFQGAETEIDSTGKDSSVLRRIVVYVPDYTTPNTSDYAIQTTESVCKQFTVNSITYQVDMVQSTDPNCPDF